MSTLLIVVICFAAISVYAFCKVRGRLKKESQKLTEILNGEIICSSESGVNPFEGGVIGGLYYPIDIQIDLNDCFHGTVISTQQKEEFKDRYISLFYEADSLVQKLKYFFITPSEIVSKLIYDYQEIDELIRQHNEVEIAELLREQKDYFDHCLDYPLDSQQRRSIISEEDNCLVVSSAGSGKTSSIVGKVKYLTEIKGVDPEKILLISYTNKAASELTARMKIRAMRGYTFHKLALDIIGKETGVKPSICDNTDALFLEIYHDLLKDDSFQKSVTKYIVDYDDEEADDEREERELREQLSERKRVRKKAPVPDMDGRTIYVRSEQERKICFALYALGVDFRYEEDYEHVLADGEHCQYRPDFSIYFEKDGQRYRIYLEHFGVDDYGRVPVWFAEDKNMTYEEANQKYNDGIIWKRTVHEKMETVLLETTSADFYNNNNDIVYKLKGLLENAGVPIRERTTEELYNFLLPRGCSQEKAFIRLTATFVALVKSSCKTIDSILSEANAISDNGSVFLINKILRPVYNQYVNELRKRNQIDFTDLIIRATEICKASRPVKYDYIIVDEFQDISIDRFKFLKALRGGNPPAKLYCVGDDWQSIYRFSGSDMSLFCNFAEYFGPTEINKIETTYRFGEPLVSLSSYFVQKNNVQIRKNVRSFDSRLKTNLEFRSYCKNSYCDIIDEIINSIPADKSIFLLGRYSFDDYYLSSRYKSIISGGKCFYWIGNRKIEFLTVHKSKGLEADYVILLQCNRDIYGFPSLIGDNPVLNYVLTESDKFPFGEERRLFYVAITRARIKTVVLYDENIPSIFVEELSYTGKTPKACPTNAYKRWSRQEDNYLLQCHRSGMNVKSIAEKMGRTRGAISSRLEKLNQTIRY